MDEATLNNQIGVVMQGAIVFSSVACGSNNLFPKASQPKALCTQMTGHGSLKCHRLGALGPAPNRSLVAACSRFEPFDDMRSPAILFKSAKDYPLRKAVTALSYDEFGTDTPIGLDTWPGGQRPTDHCTHDMSDLKDFDLVGAQQLIEDVAQGLQWLTQNRPVHESQLSKSSHVQTKIIDILDHYASQYWLPNMFKEFQGSDWRALAQAASETDKGSHFLSLLITQLCYSANSSDYGQLHHALTQIRSAGMHIHEISHDAQLNRFDCAVPSTLESTSADHTPTLVLPPKSPIIGFLLRHTDFWILGLAGTQLVTLSSNVQAHVKATLRDDQHWGYSEYYAKVVRPSFQHLLHNIENCEGSLHIPKTVHFAGHSMGGALAQFAAMDFPPIHNDKLVETAQNPRTPNIMLHLYSSTRAGNQGLKDKLMAKGAKCMSSRQQEDIVASVPPDFLGYNASDQKQYPNPLRETAEKLRLLGKNWREGFIRHKLASFLLMYVPEHVRPTFISHLMLLPPPQCEELLGYQVTTTGAAPTVKAEERAAE